MRLLAMFFVFSVAVVNTMSAQSPPPPDTSSTVACSFEDGNQMSIRYQPGEPSKKEFRMKELWPPSGSPMILFNQGEIVVANTNIAAGAYGVYVIPEKDKWTLIINKSVAAGTAYDQKQDLVRAPMETGQLEGAQPQVSVVLGAVGPRQCTMRIYYGKAGAWADFKEK